MSLRASWRKKRSLSTLRRPSLGLSVLGEGEDEVDVGGEVELARAELAERQDDKLLGLSGVTHRGPEVGALPFVEPADARADDRVGEVRGVAHGLLEVRETADVAPCNAHHLAPAQAPQVHHQGLDGFGGPGRRFGPLLQRRPVGGRGQRRGVRRPEVPARDEIREHRRVAFAAREDEVGAGEHPIRVARERIDVDPRVARSERVEAVPSGRGEGGGKRRIAAPVQPGSGHGCGAPERGDELRY